MPHGAECRRVEPCPPAPGRCTWSGCLPDAVPTPVTGPVPSTATGEFIGEQTGIPARQVIRHLRALAKEPDRSARTGFSRGLPDVLVPRPACRPRGHPEPGLSVRATLRKPSTGHRAVRLNMMGEYVEYDV